MPIRQYTAYSSIEELHNALSSCTFAEGSITAIGDQQVLEEQDIYTLQYNASINPDTTVKQAAIQAICELAELMNITTGSNAAFYDEKAAGKHEFFTVPAINSRMAPFHLVRAALKAANGLALPHIVFELALSESGYTDQQMDEHVALAKAAAISLGMNGSILYMQADHYQLDPKKYTADSDVEITRVQDAITKALENGVYNIDIDASKFETADPEKSDEENQHENARLTAVLFHHIREYEKAHSLPCTVSIGGEVGEVGGENTKYPQVNAYLKLLQEFLRELGSADAKGLSKVSINVGSVHGGALGPDGKPLESVPLDFQAHHDLYMKGVDPMNSGKHVVSVQHGASTLPKKYFPLFPAMHTGEIHLATGFQNVVWSVLEKKDAALYDTMKSLAFEKFGDKIAGHDTEAIGFMKERKRVTQFVKKELLETDAIPDIEAALEHEFSTIFHSLYTLLAPKQGIVVEGDRED